MKALLIKDWKLFMSQKQFFLITVVIVGAFLFSAKNPAFVVSYATIMYTVFTQWDEFLDDVAGEQEGLCGGEIYVWHSYGRRNGCDRSGCYGGGI